ncbi:MAG: hypothetical protein K0Q93_3021 [Nocardioidaceae bacterium]|jgi:hypothetical protein|nr:hypothetical protein [Nocardioidaceae bacterium]
MVDTKTTATDPVRVIVDWAGSTDVTFRFEDDTSTCEFSIDNVSAEKLISHLAWAVASTREFARWTEAGRDPWAFVGGRVKPPARNSIAEALALLDKFDTPRDAGRVKALIGDLRNILGGA